MQHKVDLEKLLNNAFEEEEIQEGMQKANIEKEFLTPKILEKSSEILEAGAKEIKELDNLEIRLQVSEKELSEVRLPPQKILLYLDKIKSRKSFLYLGLTVIGFTIFGYLGSGSLYIAYKVLISILLLVGISGIIFFVLYKLINWLYSRKLKRIRDAKRKELEMVELEERIRSAEQTVEKAVFENGILPELRSLLNVLLTPSYDTSLTPLMAPGLAESYTSAYEIPTESKKKLNRLLNIMPNGSIGIAGPRGAGKTTLLLSLCLPLGKEIKGRRVLSVMTSAPVEYEARDFILHIFTLVCKRVLELKGKSPLSPWRYISNLQKPQKSQFILLLTKPVAIVFLFLTGIVLIVLSQPIGELEPLKREEGVLLLGLGLIGTGILFFVIPKLLNKYRKRKESKKRVYEYKEKSSDDIVTKAQEWLNIIRFQSSYSSGWSGSLKLPIGIEGGMNVASSLSQKQLSLPEIIADYRNFIKLVAQEYRVIIGIDELDKLPSGEKAHRFLNEIKGIFGLENCFYLLSVSESALSSFDRRGLPFRNVFDSSFDDIIYVPYLNLEAAKTLIKRRVIGMPVPFVCFCYCMSGGLARDLIRTCRNLLEQVHQAPEKNSLSTLCSSLIKTDIKSKLRATSAAAKDINLEPELTKLLKEIQHIETSLEELPPSLLKCCYDRSYGVTKISAQQHYKEVLVKRNKITSLRDELGSYLYYAVTMLDFFNKDTDVVIFKEEKGLKALEQLARARQSLSLSPGIARSVITDLRELLNMDIFETQSLRPKRNMESKHSDGNTNL